MKYAALILALVLSLSSSAIAQEHPCDTNPSVAVTIQSGASYKVGFCTAASDNITAARGFVDGVVFDNLAVTAVSAPSASGQVLYETSAFVRVAKGTHVLEVASYNRNKLTGAVQLGAKSAPFSFSAEDDTPPPGAPAVKGLSR
jgi:hypothetical protein